jgi:hypothetical protein
MEQYILYVVVAAIAFYAGFKYCEYRLISHMISLLTNDELEELMELREQLENATDEEADVIIRSVGDRIDLKMIKLEMVNDRYFFYDFQNNFICQGTSKEDAVVNFRLVDKTCNRACVVSDDKKEFYIVDGVITDKLPECVRLSQ